MRRRAAATAAALIPALLLLACGGRAAPPATATPALPSQAPVATSGARTATPAAAVAATAGPRATPARTATAARRGTASLALVATLSVSLAGTNGGYTYVYSADGVAVSLESDGTFASTAPMQATLTLDANGCTVNLHLVHPQLEVAGSISDDGRTLRIASLRVSQDDVAGANPCPNAGAAPGFSGIGAGTTNLSPAAPAAIAFSDGASADLPRPAALDRYPRSATAVWTGTVRLVIPAN